MRIFAPKTRGQESSSLVPRRDRQGWRIGSDLQKQGHQLPPTARTRYDSAFQFSFDRVRIHSDNAAEEAARLLGARALTFGPDIYFGQEQYKPDSPDGQHLLAHELAHVVQQRGTLRSGEAIPATWRQENEASRTADAVERGETAEPAAAQTVLAGVPMGPWNPGKTKPAEAEARQQSPLPTRRPSVIQRKCACGGGCPKCQEEEEPLLQRKVAEPSASEGYDAIPAIPGGGERMPPGLRTFFETRMGHDFGDVRIHRGPAAATAARSVSARAFTSARDVVFDQGEYAPHSAEGMKLLAHELVHVVQQERSGPTIAHKGLSSLDDAAEREADSAAEAVMAGRSATPREVPSGVSRKMKSKAVLEPLRKAAKACLVHLHGEEKTAKAVAEELYSRRCVNYVHLDTAERQIRFEMDVNGTIVKPDKTKVTKPVHYNCDADPNRIFSDKGRKATANCSTADGQQHKEVKPADIATGAAAELSAFVDTAWGKGISECRGGKGTSDLAGPLPVLAIHNNEGDAPILDKYKDQWAPKTDPRLKGRSNPDYSADSKNKSDVFFVANPPPAPGAAAEAPDFDALKGIYNVGLQAQPVSSSGEDGSLSVALQDQRFINVEKKGRNSAGLVNIGGGLKGHDQVYVKNYAMTAKALDIFGVPEGPCPTPAAGSGTPGPDPSPADAPAPAKVPVPAGGEKKENQPFPLQEVTDETVPSKGCLHFDASTLASRKSHWSEEIARLPIRETVNWIVGAWALGSPAAPLMPKLIETAAKESSVQRDCMIAAMRSAMPALGGKVPKGSLVESAARSFSEQKEIWERKWNFTGDAFDRVSKNAAAKSKGLLTEGDKWDPGKRIHKMMWGVAKPKPATADKATDPNSESFLTAGAAELTKPEREQEILMASSAPGISRHHAGTEFDLGQSGVRKDQLDPKLWEPGGKYFDAGRYLFHNAATWGFMRPFESKGGYGKGYMAEPWHWSYWPVAQGLLEFARSHRKEMEEILHAQWADSSGKTSRPQFEFVWSNWRKFLENVDEKPRF